MSDRLPSLPLFVDDYEGATVHLTLEEDGTYMRLLRLCWRTPRCSIPDDPDWIMRRMRVDRPTYDRLVVPIITEFFKRSRGRIYQKRLLQEYVYAVDVQTKRKEAGKKGGNAKAQKHNDSASSKGSVLPEQKASDALAPSPAQPSSKREEEANASPSLAREPSKAKRSTGIRRAGIDHPLPDDWKPNLGPVAERMVAAWPDGMLDREEFTFRNHAAANGRVAKDWDAAFRTWLSKADERFKNGHGSQGNRGGTPGGYRERDNRDGFERAIDRGLGDGRVDWSAKPPGRHDAGDGSDGGELPLARPAGLR